MYTLQYTMQQVLIVYVTTVVDTLTDYQLVYRALVTAIQDVAHHFHTAQGIIPVPVMDVKVK
jgi:hypothetical protein